MPRYCIRQRTPTLTTHARCGGSRSKSRRLKQVRRSRRLSPSVWASTPTAYAKERHPSIAGTRARMLVRTLAQADDLKSLNECARYDRNFKLAALDAPQLLGNRQATRALKRVGAHEPVSPAGDLIEFLVLEGLFE